MRRTFKIFILLLSTLTSFFLQSGEKEELQLKIETLKKEIRELRLKEGEAFVQSQRTLRADAAEFVQEVEGAESYEKKAQLKEQELQELLSEQQKINKAGL